MDLQDRIKQQFTESIQTKILSAETLTEHIAFGAHLLVECLLDDHKILACGNGGSACEAMRFASEMLNRFEKERPSLPAIALTSDIATITSISNDYHYDTIFSKQVRALGHAGDVLLAISTSGNSRNIINAINTAHEAGLHVIGLTGNDGGEMTALLDSNDALIVVPETRVARIQEAHQLIIHCFCDLVDHSLFGQGVTS